MVSEHIICILSSRDGRLMTAEQKKFPKMPRPTLPLFLVGLGTHNLCLISRRRFKAGLVAQDIPWEGIDLIWQKGWLASGYRSAKYQARYYCIYESVVFPWVFDPASEISLSRRSCKIPGLYHSSLDGWLGDGDGVAW